jgi:hypothetical protein
MHNRRYTALGQALGKGAVRPEVRRTDKVSFVGSVNPRICALFDPVSEKEMPHGPGSTSQSLPETIRQQRFQSSK